MCFVRSVLTITKCVSKKTLGEAVFTDGENLFTKFIVFEDPISVRYLLIKSNIMCRVSALDTFCQPDYRAKQAHMSVTAYDSGRDGGEGVGSWTIAAKSSDERRNLNIDGPLYQHLKGTTMEIRSA